MSREIAVLVVEDESIVAMDLQATLRELGYDAYATAASAEAAITKASVRCPDLVLMDIRIAGDRDGIELAELLKERFSVPIVFLTAHADEATVQRAKRVEPYGYLVKPVKEAELRTTLEIALHRHALETRLREREKWFSSTLDSMADGVLTIDLAGKVTFMNPSAERLIGVKLYNALGRPAAQLVELRDPVSDSTLPLPVETALSTGHTVQVAEANLAAADQPQRVVSDSSSPVDDNGTLLGAVMVVRDVTEPLRSRKQRDLADRLASLGTMALGVAHEINNPLAVVMSNGSFAHDELKRLEGALPAGREHDLSAALSILDEARHAQAELVEAAMRIRSIVADLKAFARPEVSAAQNNGEVARAIDWAVRATAFELRERARLELDVAEMPAASVNELRLGQALINLLLNAAHAIEPGNPDANTIRLTATIDSQGRLAIAVADTGCGMPPDVIERIFEPFYTTKAEGTGNGLGLAVTHGIVKALGGDIRVDSQVGKGTTMQLSIPVTPQVLETATRTANADSKRVARVLVIDDEPLILRAIERTLRKHDVTCTQLALDGLQRIQRGERFDVILCDVMMPSMTGLELYEQLLRTDPDAARRITFLTGGALTARAEEFLNTVGNRRLDKPFEPRELEGIIEDALLEASQRPPN